MLGRLSISFQDHHFSNIKDYLSKKNTIQPYELHVTWSHSISGF